MEIKPQILLQNKNQATVKDVHAVTIKVSDLNEGLNQVN